MLTGRREVGDASGDQRVPLFHADSTAAVPVDEVWASLSRVGYAIIRGLATPAEVREAMAVARRSFSTELDHPVVGESPSDVRENFQKWSVGSGAGPRRAESYGRMIRVIFTPLMAEDRYGLHDLLRRLAVVRNALFGLPAEFAVDRVEDDRWTASRILQYPVGGGFIASHIDTGAVDALPSGVANYVQMLMVLTERGVDFERGGAWIESEGVRLDLESLVQLGDIVLYDEQTVHGVADIDPHRLLETTTLCGRVAGFANLYRVY